MGIRTSFFNNKFLTIVLAPIVFMVLLSTSSLGQTTSLSAKYQQARKVAFEEKDYKTAINLCKQILQEDAGHIDTKIFLGRLYYWSGSSDSAIVILEQAYNQDSTNADAAHALADVLYFEKEYKQALVYSEKGLVHNPRSRDLVTRKATILTALENYKEAYFLTDSLLQSESGNSQLQAMRAQLREYSYTSRIEATYDYSYFDEQFSESWHLVGVSYGRQTKMGPVNARVYYANRFATNGFQVEAEAYPRISNTFYTYTSIAYSPDLTSFPTIKAGFSLYGNLPKAWEAEAGVRYLHFDNDIWAYTFAAGKYVGNFWINGKVYLTKDNASLANSYTLTTRYYLKGANNYASVIVGWGVSPDDRTQAIKLNLANNLQTFTAGAGYRFMLSSRHVVGINCTYENVEYLPEIKGNQINISTLYQFRF